MTQGAERPGNVLPLPRWTLILHAVQFFLAIVILGLAAYGVHWIGYGALIWTIICALATFAVCGYIVGTTLFAHKLYIGVVVFGLHCIMALVWIINMGLVANLARAWGVILDLCYTYTTYSSYGTTATYRDCLGDYFGMDGKVYRGTLIAGALLSAIELVLWAVSGVFVGLYLNRQRNDAANASQQPATAGKDQPVPMNQIPHQTDVSHPQSQQYMGTGGGQGNIPQQYAASPQPPYAQPVQPYAQDPINRIGTVSPVSHAGYSTSAPQAPEIASPQHTGAYGHNVSELSTPRHESVQPTHASELSSHK